MWHHPIVLISFAGAIVSAAEPPVLFNRDIRPLFMQHCSACHGGVKEAGGISFIYRDKALGIGKSGEHPIVPGKPAESAMLRRIKSSDPDEVMPKPKHGPPLTAGQISLIERWIAQGAEWQEHWAYLAPQATPTPAVSDPAWPTSTLDAYVLARLDQEKLKPAPEATAAEWLRRASFDLTGLPPSAEELRAFETSVGNDPMLAREQVVDRLLASQRYGERWAAVWLDLARYSDTYGFEKDPARNIWPYRDWVIRAFNQDMAYDEFTIEQLAGDLLPNASAEQRLATGFHRNTQNNTEGGTDDEEFRVAAVIDRANTTWTTWQGTTFGCVQCHSHPYDPIRHEEFYRFAAFFNNTEDCDLDDDFPTRRIATDPAKREVAAALETQLHTLRGQLNERGRALAAATVDWQPFTPDAFVPSHGTLAVAADGTIRSEGTLPVGCSHKFSGPAAPFTALRLRLLPTNDDPKKWPERGALASAVGLKLIDAAGVATAVPLKEVFADYLAGPYDPMTAIHGGGGAGDFPKLNGPRWFVFVPEQAVTATPGMRLEVTVKQDGATTGNQATPLRRFGLDLTNQAAWSALVIDPERLAGWQSHQSLKQQLDAIAATLVPEMVERAAGGQRETRVFARGNRLSKEQTVVPGLPAVLAPGTAEAACMNRLELARWLVSERNPLSARVLANRLWGEMFGIGIVETAEDFGAAGTPPSHPELLDHLALRLREHHHWSVKGLLKDIALSATYRQSNSMSAALAGRDPHNRLLARGPRTRLSAEMLRDQALAVGGLLSAKMYGPPVFPPQPAGVWNSVYSGATWTESQGEDRFRRGIYTYSKRTSGFPGFLTFDAPSHDLCCPRRLATNTPLQALVTLNDPAHIEAAQGLAKRMAEHSAGLREQLACGVLLVTQQAASAAMLDELAALHAAASADYQATPALSAKLAATPEAAALVLTANTLLNLDSALTK
ncbi:MAG: PSD1 and planctomycete cytochrome C domain-containing protein [Verrucomicrobiota bacterium]